MPNRMNVTARALGLALPLMLICLDAHASEEKVVGVGTFVTDQAHAKPTFAPGDEKVVREFAEGLGQEFDQQMELPWCMMRGRLATPGAYFDAYVDSNKGLDPWNAYARIPIPNSQVKFNGAAPYNDAFTRMVYLEATYAMGASSASWHFELVLPPLRANAGVAEMPFRVASASVGDVPLKYIEVQFVPGLPTYVRLKGFAEALEQAGADTEMRFSVMPVAAADANAPRVHIIARLPQLKRDLDTAVAELAVMKARDDRKACDVVSRDCRDGECR